MGEPPLRGMYHAGKPLAHRTPKIEEEWGKGKKANAERKIIYNLPACAVLASLV